MKAKGKKAAPKKSTTRKGEPAKNLATAPAPLPAAPATVETTATIETTAAPIANDVALEALVAEAQAPDSTPPPAASERRPMLSSAERHRLIAQRAYARAERFGFGRTNPVEDWLLAEREVDSMLVQVAV